MAESVGSVTRSPSREEHGRQQPAAVAWEISPSTPERPSPAATREQRGACFTCQQEGHWSRDCPSRGSGERIPGARRRCATEPGADGFPEVQCPCGASPCVVLVSSTEKNPGRLFYRCPVHPREEKCNFFQWFDTPSPIRKLAVNTIQQRVQDIDDHPTCPCGAGLCVVLTMEDGENAVREYFACPGTEKCGFFRWCDMPSPILHSVGNSQQQHAASPVHQYIQYPMCSCGAGRCRLLTMEGGEHAGRRYFACAVKRGQGACNFFKWFDSMGEDHATNDHKIVETLSKPPADMFMATEPRANNGRNVVDKEDGLQHARLDDEKEALPSELPIGTDRSEDKGGADLLRPIEKLSLREGSPGVVAATRRRGRCFRCGEEGHWTIECAGFLPSPCYRCGKIGHRSKYCTSA